MAARLLISVECENCGTRLKGPEKAIGRKVKCKKCEHRFLFQPDTSDEPTPTRNVEPSAKPQTNVSSIPASATQRVADLVTKHQTPSILGMFGAAVALMAYWFSLAVVGAFVLFHLVWNFTMLTGGRGSLLIMIPVFILILLVSIAVLVIMLKPIRASRTRNVARSIKPNVEPRLFDLINQVADCVGAARPNRVEVDYEFGAFAEPLDSFADLSGQDLYLRIGLPVLACCTTEDFTSLLSTKLGLYSSTRNNKQTLFVRNTIDWLHRSAFEQDSWDGIPKRMLTSEKFQLVNKPGAYLLQCCFFVIVRLPFRLLYFVTRAICKSDLKKQELNSDAISLVIHGRDNFEDFLLEHQRLKLAQKSAFNDFVDSIESAYSIGNVFDVMRLKRKYLNEYQLEDVRTEVDAGKTNSFDSSNSDLERIRDVKAFDLDLETVDCFNEIQPVKDLLNSYPILASQCTNDLRSYLQERLTGTPGKKSSKSRQKRAAELERYIRAAVREGFKSAN